MNINFEISDIKKRTEGDAEEKIISGHVVSTVV